MIHNSFTSNSKIKLVISILFLVFIIFLIDHLVSIPLNSMALSARNGKYCGKYFAAIDYKADLLLHGNSRIYKQLIPDTLEKVLDVSVFNSGLNGISIYSQNSALMYMIDRGYTPENLVMTVRRSSCNVEIDSGFDKLSVIYDHPIIKERLLKLSKKNRMYLVLRSLKYNSKLFYILKEKFLARDVMKSKGYAPIIGKLNQEVPDTVTTPHIYKEEIIDEFILTMKKCKEHNINLIFVDAPIFTIDKNDYPEKFTRNRKEMNIPILDYNNGEYNYLKKPEYFYDVLHLNEEGAEKFSPILAEDLKRYIKHKD